MLGLDGFRVLEMVEDPDELIIIMETTSVIAGVGVWNPGDGS